MQKYIKASKALLGADLISGVGQSHGVSGAVSTGDRVGQSHLIKVWLSHGARTRKMRVKN